MVGLVSQNRYCRVMCSIRGEDADLGRDLQHLFSMVCCEQQYAV